MGELAGLVRRVWVVEFLRIGSVTSLGDVSFNVFGNDTRQVWVVELQERMSAERPSSARGCFHNL